MSGLIMPDPLAIPVIVISPSGRLNFFESPLAIVSVVRIASAISFHASSLRLSSKTGIAFFIFSTGKGSAITPVENGNILSMLVPA